MSLLPPIDMLKGIMDEAKTVPWIALSLMCAWAAIWTGYGYGYFEIYPVVAENSTKLAAVTDHLENVEGKLDDLTGVVTEGRISDLDKAIIEYRTKQCTATSADSKQYWAQQLSRTMRDYERLTAQQPRIPSCEEVQ